MKHYYVAWINKKLGSSTDPLLVYLSLPLDFVTLTTAFWTCQFNQSSVHIIDLCSLYIISLRMRMLQDTESKVHLKWIVLLTLAWSCIYSLDLCSLLSMVNILSLLFSGRYLQLKTTANAGSSSLQLSSRELGKPQ